MNYPNKKYDILIDLHFILPWHVWLINILKIFKNHVPITSKSWLLQEPSSRISWMLSRLRSMQIFFWLASWHFRILTILKDIMFLYTFFVVFVWNDCQPKNYIHCYRICVTIKIRNLFERNKIIWELSYSNSKCLFYKIKIYELVFVEFLREKKIALYQREN